MSLSPLRALLFAIPLLLAACGGETGASEKGKADKANDANAGAIGASDMVMGASDAPVTVIEYASVTCPHCAAFHEEVLPGIKEKYIDTGKIRLAFREFPTPPQGLSYVGSVLARCAAEKGGPDAYFLIIGTLFKTQKIWIYGDDPRLELVKIATQTGMDEASFDACMQRQDLVDLINGNVSIASEKFAIDSTPSFMLNGVVLETGKYRTADELRQFLETKFDEALANAAG